MNLDLTVRLTLLGLLGLVLGSFANWAIYRWAFFRAPVSPWLEPPKGHEQRSWVARLPVVGWWTRAAEVDAQLDAARARLTLMGYEVPKDWRPRLPFWFRPMLIELGMAFVVPWLYWFETEAGGLLPQGIQVQAVILQHQGWFHWLYMGHLVLLLAMVVATFIDFDEQLIPDIITIPVTLLAMVLGACSLHTFLPCPVVSNGVMSIVPTTLGQPGGWSEMWQDPLGLGIGCFLWTGWCFALSNRRIITRQGWGKVLPFFVAIMRRDPMSKWLLLIWIVGMVFVGAIWQTGGTAWQGLATALMGMAIGGGTIWAVRIVAGLAMGEEAMGFGDVTLMAMVGGFVGWQATGAAFFIAPLTSIFIVLLSFLLTGQRMTPFGPYLCAGTIVTILYWPVIWTEAILPALLLGPLFLTIMLVALLAMGILLGIWRMIKTRLFA